MDLEVYKSLVKVLIKQVAAYKSSIAFMSPTGWQKEYLRYLWRSIVNLQRAILQFDSSRTNLRIFFSGETYKLACRALSYDPYLDFRKSIQKHDNLVNDTFLFVE